MNSGNVLRVACMRFSSANRVRRVESRTARLRCDVQYAGDFCEVVGAEAGASAFARLAGHVERSAGAAAAQGTQAMAASEVSFFPERGCLVECIRAHAHGAMRVRGTVASTGCESIERFRRDIAEGCAARDALGGVRIFPSNFHLDTSEGRDTHSRVRMRDGAGASIRAAVRMACRKEVAQ